MTAPNITDTPPTTAAQPRKPLVITISAAYGAAGSVIAPRVADILQIDFLNRGSTPHAWDQQDHPPRTTSPEAPNPDEDVSLSWWKRVLEALASVPDEYGSHLAVPPGTATDALRAESEQHIHQFLEQHRGGVILGYAAAVVVGDAFKVRLDGPRPRRLQQGMMIENIDEHTAAERLDKSDTVRSTYWKRLYQQDISSPRHYHLWLDTTVFPIESAAQWIAQAAMEFDAARYEPPISGT